MATNITTNTCSNRAASDNIYAVPWMWLKPNMTLPPPALARTLARCRHRILSPEIRNQPVAKEHLTAQGALAVDLAESPHARSADRARVSGRTALAVAPNVDVHSEVGDGAATDAEENVLRALGIVEGLVAHLRASVWCQWPIPNAGQIETTLGFRRFL